MHKNLLVVSLLSLTSYIYAGEITIQTVQHDGVPAEPVATTLVYSIEDGSVLLTDVLDNIGTGKLIIPSTIEGYQVIGDSDNTFRGSQFNAIVYPEGYEFVGRSSAYNMPNLVYVELPSTIDFVGHAGFSGEGGWRSQLSTIVFNGGPPSSMHSDAFGRNNDVWSSPAGAVAVVANPTNLPLFGDSNTTYGDLWGEPNNSYSRYILSAPTTNVVTTGDGAVAATLSYTISSDGDVTIIDCNEDASGALVIPTMIDNSLVTNIGDNAFRNTQITSVTFQDGISTIGDNVFFKSNYLTEATFAATVSSIGDMAFYVDSSLSNYDNSSNTREGRSFTFYGDPPTMSGNQHFGDGAQTADIFLHSPDNWGTDDYFTTYQGATQKYIFTTVYPTITVATSGENAVPAILTYEIAADSNGDPEVYIRQCNPEASGKLTVPQTIEGYPVTKLVRYGLKDTALNSVILQEGITATGDGTFAQNGYGQGQSPYSESLTYVEFPSTLDAMGADVFIGAYNVKTIVMHGSRPTSMLPRALGNNGNHYGWGDSIPDDGILVLTDTSTLSSYQENLEYGGSYYGRTVVMPDYAAMYDLTSAQTAQANAEAAQATAEANEAIAVTAQQAAESAQATAEANEASAVADKNTALTAQANAEASAAAAITERDAALSAQATAEADEAAAISAKELAESAQISAEIAQTSAEAAQAAAESSEASAVAAKDLAEAAQATAEANEAAAIIDRNAALASQASAEATASSALAAQQAAESAQASAESAQATAETNAANAENLRILADAAKLEAQALVANLEYEKQVAVDALAHILDVENAATQLTQEKETLLSQLENEYTLEEIEDLRAGSTTIQVTGGQATLNMFLEKSSDLDSWTPADSTSVTIQVDPDNTQTQFFRFRMD